MFNVAELEAYLVYGDKNMVSPMEKRKTASISEDVDIPNVEMMNSAFDRWGKYYEEWDEDDDIIPF